MRDFDTQAHPAGASPPSVARVHGMSPELPRLDALPQTVVGHGRDLNEGEFIAAHHHQRHQLIHASRGVMVVTTHASAFVVPPQCGVWMPGGISHQVEARTHVAMRTLLLSSAHHTADLPSEPCVVRVRPLLRELIRALVNGPSDYLENSSQGRIAAVILDELEQLPTTPLALPMPKDRRVQTVAQCLRDNPSDERGLSEFARVANVSERTLSRVFHNETGMAFRHWRQQLRVMRAVELLAQGQSVTHIALELGYANPSAFSAMFRRCLGVAPGHYLRRER